jgi:Ca-activated chloride channel family protein
MTFRAPGALLALLLVPVLVVGYLWLVRRRAVDEAALGTMAEGATRGGRNLGWRRHVVPVVFLLGIVVLLVALARPEATIDLPQRKGTVMLAFDVSSSMKAKDLEPTRMAAAKRAAKTFVGAQPSNIRIGVVAFSDSANVVQAPTRSRHDVLAAIDRLSPRGGTALGRGILS